MHTYMVMLKIYSDMRILGTMLRPAARLLACPPVCWPPLSARLVCSPAPRACFRSRRSAANESPSTAVYNAELLPLRAPQGHNLSAHVCIMWQLFAPHKRKHIIKQVLTDGPTLSLLPMELRRDATVETIPPVVDTLCARHVGNLGRFFLQTQFPSELWLTATALIFPGTALTTFGQAGAPSKSRVVTLVGLRRRSGDESISSCAASGGGAEPGGTNLIGSLAMTPGPSRCFSPATRTCPCQYFGKGLSRSFIELRQRAWAAATSVWKLGFVGLTLMSPMPCPSPGVHMC